MVRSTAIKGGTLKKRSVAVFLPLAVGLVFLGCQAAGVGSSGDSAGGDNGGGGHDDDNGLTAPSGVALARVGLSSVQVKWTDNARGEAGYEVARNGAVVGAVAANTTGYTDTGVPLGTHVVSYWVRAVGVGTTSAWSDDSSILVDLAERRVGAADGALDDHFGYSVAIDGDTALIGAPRNDGAGDDSGSAYIFTRTEGAWAQHAELTADGALDDHFGYSVAIDGDIALIGAPRDEGVRQDTGSAYIFTRTGGTWVRYAKLTTDDANVDSQFGYSVAIDGDTALIGAPRDDGVEAGSTGSAYIFTRTEEGTWEQHSKIGPPYGTPAALFGNSVAIDGDTALVGAPRDDGVKDTTGSAYIFTRTGGGIWTLSAKLTVNDLEEFDWFGNSVAIDGDTAFIGVPEYGVGGRAGLVYVFTRTGNIWTLSAKLTADDGDDYDYFGYSVAVDGDTLLIGASYDDAGDAIESGSAYIFTRTGGIWAQYARLTAGDADEYDYFGCSVAIDGDTLLIGAASSDAGVENTGSAYFYAP